MPLILKSTPPYYTTANTPGIITLTNSQIINLEASPQTLITAPGTGKMIIPTLAIFSSNITTDYTNINAAAKLIIRCPGAGTLMQAFNTTDNSVTSLLSPTSWLGDTKAIGWVLPFQYTTGDTNTKTGMYAELTSEYENRPIVIQLTNNGAGILTAGNAANTLKIQIFYQIINL